jgi:hypothetical protein
MIQAVLFSRNNFNTRRARQWLRQHNLVPIKRVHKTPGYLRYRIMEPDSAASYSTKKVKEGIKIVLMYF